MSAVLVVVLVASRVSGAQGPVRRTAAAIPHSEDSLVVTARKALDEGRPWRATNLLAPALADSSRRTPHLVLLAATAASQWEGWDQVNRLLASEPWLDTLFGGRGRALLARAALARNDDSLALSYARQAVASASDSLERGQRMVQLARAFGRLHQNDSARATYERAAALLPRAHDWLLLRAASVTTDSTQRSRDYAALRTDVARAQVMHVDAAARERSGDLAGAALEYDSMGARLSALRLRLVLATTDSGRSAVRRGLLDVIASRRTPASDARDAIALLDSAFTPLAPSEELTVARRAATAGPLARAAAGFARVLDAHGTSEDRFTYATVLQSLGRTSDAAEQFARVRTPSSLAGLASYQRARSVLQSGQLEKARRLLRETLRTYRTHPTAASSALYLLADLATDEGRDSAARDAYLTIAREYPTSTWASAAHFRAALIAFVDSAPKTAAHEFDEMRLKHPHGDEAAAAGYWSGRAWARVGDTARAHARWRDVVASSPASYYAVVSSRRLGIPMWAPPAAADSFPRLPQVDSAMARAALLSRIGLDSEATIEYDQLAAQADGSMDRLLATAAAFRDAGLASRAIRLGMRALDRGAPRTTALYRLIYPVRNTDGLLAETRADSLDPALVAALVRQESAFQPHATSGAGARGLMQVMPSVGRSIATSLRYPFWDDVLLYQPDVNLQIGCIHLAEMLRQYGGIARALAAYNAGGSRVDRWSTKRGVQDPDVFIERIPFTETRDYVRIIERNRAMYRGVYGWGVTPPTVPSASAPR
ncbi:MAG TPA: transglycosylase SLT domain-containing protein [Gemmatimonadaceae bacterium]|nr:transglycosylase SLT domain-containing protein [Gemmatimonadaceae bacterium]